MTNEVWLPVVGFEDLYEVSDSGRVKTSGRRGHGRRIGRILKLLLNGGYPYVYLRHNSSQKFKYIHRLVAQAFIGQPPTLKHEVNHKNCIKTDNTVGNLEWLTHSENMNHASENGRFTDHRGSKNYCSKLSEQQVIEIRRLYAEGFGQTEIGKMFDVTQTTIYYVVHRVTWTHI